MRPAEGCQFFIFGSHAMQVQKFILKILINFFIKIFKKIKKYLKKIKKSPV